MSYTYIKPFFTFEEINLLIIGLLLLTSILLSEKSNGIWENISFNSNSVNLSLSLKKSIVYLIQTKKNFKKIKTALGSKIKK